MLVEVRRRMAAAMHEFGAERITEAHPAQPLDDREAVVTTFDFVIDGLSFAARVSLLRGTH